MRDKRLPLLVALVVLGVGSVLFGVSPHFWPGSCLLAAVAETLFCEPRFRAALAQAQDEARAR